MVAAAVIGGAVIAGGSALGGAALASSATSGASKAAIAEQNAALGQEATLSAPYRALGESAIPQYENLLGLGPQGNAGILQALQSMPGYQFAQQQGEQGIVNAASTTGGVSGNTLEALDQFNTGLAQQTYQTNLADIGQAVGTGQAAAAGQAQNVAGGASNISSLISNQGNTQAGIDANLAAALSKTAGNTTNDVLISQYLNQQAQPPAAAGPG